MFLLPSCLGGSKFPITEGDQTQAVKEATEKTRILDIIGLNDI